MQSVRAPYLGHEIVWGGLSHLRNVLLLMIVKQCILDVLCTRSTFLAYQIDYSRAILHTKSALRALLGLSMVRCIEQDFAHAHCPLGLDLEMCP